MLKKSSITGISLDAAGLVALADLSTILRRTAITGTASFLDILLLAPGIHRQQNASDINGGELPITGAMTTGYVFRIENQGTVAFLQTIGEPGCLVTLDVVRRAPASSLVRRLKLPQGLFISGFVPGALYLTSITITIIAIALLGVIRDGWAIGVLSMLMVARLINVVVIKRRATMDWKGAKEEGKRGDLLVFLSQDRWIRMRGLVDDLKAVTAGQWLRDEAQVEGFATAFSTLLVYAAAALAGNASTIGSLIIACLLLVSVALLGVSNSLTQKLQMFGCILSATGEPKRYQRRLDMANELVESSGRKDWAIAMGLILPDKDHGHPFGCCPGMIYGSTLFPSARRATPAHCIDQTEQQLYSKDLHFILDLCTGDGERQRTVQMQVRHFPDVP